MDDEIERTKREKIKKMLGWRINPVIKVSDENFDEKVVEKSRRIPVVVDFWAKWCMPCLVLSPTIERLSKEYNGKFVLAKINVDKNRATAQKFRIMSIPNVKLFKDGKVTDEFVGVLPEPAIRQWLDKNLNK